MRLSLCLTAAVWAAALTAHVPTAQAFAPADPKCVDPGADPDKLKACVVSLDQRLQAQEKKLDDLADDKQKDDQAKRLSALEKKFADEQAAEAKLDARVSALEGKPNPNVPVHDVPGSTADPVALAARVSALEAKLNGDVKLKNVTVEGSLTVTDGGKSIFLVRDAAKTGGSGTEMLVGSEGEASLLVTASGDNATLRIGGSGSNDYAEITHDDKGADIDIHHSANDYALLSDDAHFAGLRIADSGGVFANFGRNMESGSTGARILSGDDVIAGLVATKAGQAIMSLTQPGSKVARVAAMSDAEGGSIYIAANDKPVIELSAHERRLALLNGDNVIAELRKSKSTEGGNVSVYDASNGMRFSAGATSDEGGAACVFRKENYLVTCLGIGLPGVGGGSQ